MTNTITPTAATEILTAAAAQTDDMVERFAAIGRNIARGVEAEEAALTGVEALLREHGGQGYVISFEDEDGLLYFTGDMKAEFCISGLQMAKVYRTPTDAAREIGGTIKRRDGVIGKPMHIQRAARRWAADRRSSNSLLAEMALDFLIKPLVDDI